MKLKFTYNQRLAITKVFIDIIKVDNNVADAEKNFLKEIATTFEFSD